MVYNQSPVPRLQRRLQIGLLRHGIAEDQSESGHDSDRRLTAEGRITFQREAELLANRGVTFDLIATSPYPRAAETAAIMEKCLTAPPHFFADKRLKPGCQLHSLIEIVIENPEVNSMLFVGHNPDLSVMTAQLCGAKVEMKKGGMALLDIWRLEPGGGTLKWFVTPSILGAKKL